MSGKPGSRLGAISLRSCICPQVVQLKVGINNIVTGALSSDHKTSENLPLSIALALSVAQAKLSTIRQILLRDLCGVWHSCR